MQVIVKGHNTHVPDHVKEVATQKLEKVKRFLDRINSLEIEFSEEHNPRIADKHRVEVTLTTKHHLLRAHASGPDPMSAVDLVLDKLEAQVKRLKGKMVRRGSRTGHSAKGPRNQATGSLPSLDELPSPSSANGSGSLAGDEGVEGGGSAISRIKRFTVKPMTADEAVLQMESLGHDFYLFVNAESEQAGVVYRRRDGSFGLIEPD